MDLLAQLGGQRHRPMTPVLWPVAGRLLADAAGLALGAPRWVR
jgi:hypothetical protein